MTAKVKPARKGKGMEALERDALRYRFLRNIESMDDDGLRVTEAKNIKWGSDAPGGERLDEAIDLRFLATFEAAELHDAQRAASKKRKGRK